MLLAIPVEPFLMLFVSFFKIHPKCLLRGELFIMHSSPIPKLVFGLTEWQ